MVSGGNGVRTFLRVFVRGTLTFAGLLILFLLVQYFYSGPFALDAAFFRQVLWACAIIVFMWFVGALFIAFRQELKGKDDA